jgi:outer membrane protein
MRLNFIDRSNRRTASLSRGGAVVLGSAVLAIALGCESQTSLDEIKVSQYEQRMVEEKPFEPVPELTRMDQPAPTELSGKVAATQPALDSVLWLHLPDPSVAEEVLQKRLEVTRFSPAIKREYEKVYAMTVRYIQDIKRPKQLQISLADALRRALANNYQIRVDGYAPAISTAQVVQAEAAFDTAFFANINRNNTDQPSPNQFPPKTDTTTMTGGIRKILATGATVTLSHNMVRVENRPSPALRWNPVWTDSFAAELRQPLLRNFGIDFNRAQINIRKLQRQANEEAFRGRVIDILNQTEQAYWTLVAVRRDVVTSAETLAHAQNTLDQVEARRDFDAYQTLVYRSQTAVKAREFDYINVKNRVRNAEDQLLNLLNDPDMPLSADCELIPIDNPMLTPVVRDRFKIVETALERRPELLQARDSVDIARLQLGIAKNQALPQLDAVYRMTVNGIGGNAAGAWDQMTGGNFTDNFVGIEFAWNFGERAERAGIRIAALQQSQTVLQYKRSLDDVITDCRVALRNLETNYEQISPSHQAVIAAHENLRSLQERQERKSPAELDTILSAQVSLAETRRGFLQAVTQYNTGIIDVERAKGTLLEYDNVVLSQQP